MQQPPNPYPQYPQQQWQQPPFPPQQYQQPLQYQSPIPPPKKKSRKRLWLILAAVVLVLAVVIGVASQGQSQQPSPTAQATHATQQPILQPTTKPTSTATTALNSGPAILGALLSAFTTKFGQPNDHSSPSQPHLARCNNSNIDELILSQVSIQSATGVITSIAFQLYPGMNNAVSAVEAECSAFFPADAVYQKTVTIPGSPSQFPAFDKIYYSATLAHEFAADNFTDASQNPVKPGLFDTNYLFANDNDTSHIDS